MRFRSAVAAATLVLATTTAAACGGGGEASPSAPSAGSTGARSTDDRAAAPTSVVASPSTSTGATPGVDAADPPAPGSAEPPPPLAEAEAGPAPGDATDPGIDVDEAHRIGATTADFDALVTGPRPATGGRATFVVRNVGRRPDTYTLTVDPAGAGHATPASLTLAPGGSAEVVVRWGAAGRLDVVSTGRAASLATIDLT
jgi:hypothetical protein